MVGCDIEHVRVVWRELDREGPLEAVLQRFRATAHAGDFRPDVDGAFLKRLMVVANQPPIARATTDCSAVNDVGVIGTDGNVATLTPAGLHAFLKGDRAVAGLAGQGKRGVVLLGAIDLVRVLIVSDHMIELRRWLVVDAGPGLATVEADVCASVVAFDHAVGVVRVDPEILVVAVRRWDGTERLAAIDGLPALQVQNPDRVGVARVGEDVHVIPGTPPQVAVVTDHLPGVAAVV